MASAAPKQISYVLPTRKIARYRAIPLDTHFTATHKVCDQDEWVPMTLEYSKEEKAAGLSPDKVHGQNHLILMLKRKTSIIGMD
jgi:hypothetical protein